MTKRRLRKLIREAIVASGIIVVLVGLILWTSWIVQERHMKAMAEAQVNALSTAIESYRRDHGDIPLSPESQAFMPESATEEEMQAASLELYKALSGDHNLDRQPDPDRKSYLQFKPYKLRLHGFSGEVTAIIDPYGHPFGYATPPVLNDSAHPKDRTEFYLWSARRRLDKPHKWIKNW